MLWRTFGETSYSKYNDTTDIGSSPETAAAVGHVNYDGDWLTHKNMMLDSERIYFVKTHEPPEDDSPALYIVRESTAAIVSNYHYWKNFENRDFTFEDLISGTSGPFLSWGAHLDAWDPLQRNRTLVLRYEDLIHAPEEQLRRISEFTSLDQKAPWINDFAKLNKISPKFFRRGKIEVDKRELTPSQLRLTQDFHEDWSQRLNYITNKNGFEALYSCKYLRSLVKQYRTFQLKNEQLSNDVLLYKRESKRAAKSLQKHIDGLLHQVEDLSSTSQQQAKHIGTLEQECARLISENKSASAEAKRAIREAQRHIDELLTQLKRLAATSEQQAEYIAVLTQERDRLTALTATQVRDCEHYVKVINEQSAYIRQLEQQRHPGSTLSGT